jgi:nitrate reductase gamma subunit
MTALTIVYALAFYAVTALLVWGVGAKVRQYWRTPAPLKIPTMPAPTTTRGVVGRMAREVLLFESLFKATPWTWLFGWLFHVGLALVLVRHLRYFTEPVWGVVVLMQSAGLYSAFAMSAGLVGLLVRRIAVDRVRYISSPSDHLMLVLMLAIAGSGLGMKYVLATDVVAVKAFFIGLMQFAWQPLPADPLLLVHITLVLGLMAIFPFSKLLHAPGVFFSPTRNQRDDSRERRHIPPWANHHCVATSGSVGAPSSAGAPGPVDTRLESRRGQV